MDCTAILQGLEVPDVGDSKELFIYSKFVQLIYTLIKYS